MEKQEKVIDASVMVKWFLHEQNSDIAVSLKDSFLKGEIGLIAPDLIILELANSLRYKKQKEKEILLANKRIWELGIKLVRINDAIMSKTIENSIKYNITVYDALYITLAQIHGTFLITADRELYKIPNVIALEKI